MVPAGGRLCPHFTVYLPKLRVSFLFIVYMFAKRAPLMAMMDSGTVGSCHHVWPQWASFTSTNRLEENSPQQRLWCPGQIPGTVKYIVWLPFVFFLCIHVLSVDLRILEQFWTLRNQNGVTREDYRVWNWSGLYLVEQAPPPATILNSNPPSPSPPSVISVGSISVAGSQPQSESTG